MFGQSIKRWANRAWLPWVVWAVGSCFIAYQFSFQISSAIMVPQLMHAFHLTPAGVGFLSSTFFYTYLLMQIPAGILMDHYSYRRILLLGVALFVVGLVLFATATSLNVAIMARLIMGLATAPAVAVALCLAANWFSTAMFVLVASLTEVIGMLGGLFGEGYMAHWVERLGWRQSLWIWFALGVLLWLATWYWVYDAPITAAPAEKHQLMGWRSCLIKAKNSLMEVAGNGRIWLNGIFGGMTFAVNSAFAGLWGVPFCRSVFHLSFETSAWLMSLFFVGVMLGGASMSLACRWFRCRWRLMRWMTLGSVVSTLLLMWLTSFPHLLGATVPALGTVLVIMGVFSSIYIIPFANICDLVSPRSRGTAMAFANTCCIAVGAPLLQPLFGSILHHFHAATAAGIRQGIHTVHAFQWCLFTLVICALLAWVLAWLLTVQDSSVPSSVTLADEVPQGSVQS